MESPFVELPIRESEQTESSALTDLVAEYSPFGSLETDTAWTSYPGGSTEHLVRGEDESPVENPYRIDIQRAINGNNQYQQQLWGNQFGPILKYFSSIGISSNGAPTDSRHFALLVAKWQALQHNARLKVDGVLGPGSWAVMKPLLATTPVTPAVVQPPSQWLPLIKDTAVCRAEPLLHGAQAYQRMVHAIETATNSSHYIYILGWMLDVNFTMIPGDENSKLITLLRKAALRGVEIRIQIWDNPWYQPEINTAVLLVNTLPNTRLVKDNYTFGSLWVKNAIAKARDKINSMPDFLEASDKFKDTKEFLNIIQNEGSHHEKILIVKGTEDLVAFCGGIDINPNRVYGVDSAWRSTVLHDVHCELHDHAAWKLLQHFRQRWQVLSERNSLTLPLRNCINEPDPGEKPGLNSAHVKVLHTSNHPSGYPKDRSIRETVKIAIENARETIHIEDQYMISLEIATWLNRKILDDQNFKRVTFLTQDDSNAKDDLKYPKYMRQKFIDTLKSGLKARGLEGKVSVQMLHPDSPPFAHHRIHSKLYIIDDDLVIIGSANCSSRSMTHDSETAAVIFNDPGTRESFVSKLLTKMKNDPLLHVTDYKPNPNVRDLDEDLILDVAKATALAGTVGSLPGMPGVAVVTLAPLALRKIKELKPLVIDVIDPDADGTIPQQELGDVSNEGGPESSFESSALQGSSPAGQYEVPANQPVSSPRRALDPSSFLSPDKSNKATELNQKQVQKSGLAIADIVAALSNNVDLTGIRTALSVLNGTGASGRYGVAGQSVPVVDAVFTEAVHQFQKAKYIDAREQDGVLGMSTMDTLGFVRHGLRPKLSSGGFWGQKQLNRSDIKPQVPQLTNNEYTASNWFEYIMRPAWLGVKITSGVHIALMRKLLEAENWLLTQQQYSGMTSAELGKALGLSPATGYSAARLSDSNQAMHGFGLAIDINVWGNPWIGAGWISGGEEGPHMIKTLRNASGNQALPGSTVFAYLHSIAQSSGTDTWASYDTLKQRNDEFVSYLRTNSAELAYWRKSYTFGGRNPLNGFFNLHRDLVYALRQVAGLAWGAIDIGEYASGDIMHFDLRTLGVGKLLSKNTRGFIPTSGHPTIQPEFAEREFEFHEAINEAEWWGVTEVEGDTSFAGAEILPEVDQYDREKAIEEGDSQRLQVEFDEHETVTADWSRAVRLNRYYAASLGWDRFYDQINNLLLPLSGQENVSLGEEAFAQALAAWQQQQGFGANDVDGILGPNTWARMQAQINAAQSYIPINTVTPSIGAPAPQNIREFNRWHAQKILDNMIAGYVGQAFDSKGQLEKIVRGEQVLNVNPNSKIVQMLPVMYHISEQAKLNDYKEIIFGSFIRSADPDGSCTGHCEGRCLDINHTGGSFDKPGSVQMVINILTYLLSLPAQYKKPLGFGMPLQGGFFGNVNLKKFNSVSPSLLRTPQLVQLVTQLGYVFPDNNNHLHIQIKWFA
jgi:phosphatidylserine/phosphatidylglycerophosphate/cardiolipin synthase-like enzyme